MLSASFLAAAVLAVANTIPAQAADFDRDIIPIEAGNEWEYAYQHLDYGENFAWKTKWRIADTGRIIVRITEVRRAGDSLFFRVSRRDYGVSYEPSRNYNREGDTLFAEVDGRLAWYQADSARWVGASSHPLWDRQPFLGKRTGRVEYLGDTLGVHTETCSRPIYGLCDEVTALEGFGVSSRWNYSRRGGSLATGEISTRHVLLSFRSTPFRHEAVKPLDPTRVRKKAGREPAPVSTRGPERFDAKGRVVGGEYGRPCYTYSYPSASAP